MAQESSKPGKPPLRLGKYEVLGRLGKGGMGTVFRAIDTQLQRLVALKILSPEMASKPGMLKRFQQEARSAARLRHENIVSIYEINEQNGTVYLALEYVEGKDLHDYVSTRGKLPPDEAREILLQAARALDHAHREGIVHRDIKPSNFLVSTTGGKLLVKLTDMGLARVQGEESARLTRDHTTVGTIDYMAPEQAHNSRAADIRSDIYSLGCTLYHMLAGHAPFPRGSIPERIISHMKAEPVAIETLNERVSPDLARVLRKMMAKKPRDRYQTPAEIIADLEDPAVELRPLEPAPATDRPEEKPSPTVRPASSKKPSTEIAAPSPAPASEETEPETRRRKGKKRFRDESAKGTGRGLQLSKGAKAGLGVAGVAVAALAIYLLTRSGDPPVKDGGDPKPPVSPPPLVQVKDPKDEPSGKDEPPVFGPPAPTLPALYSPSARLDPPVLRKELSVDTPFPTAPDGASVIPWRRGAGPDEASSLSAALARAGDGNPVVIEIRDQGPLWLPSQALWKNRNVHLRAAPGVRPLLAWDLVAQKREKGKPVSLFALEQGSLTLEGIDLVVKCDEVAAGSCTLFRLDNASLYARDCTFSLTGKSSVDLSLVHSTAATPVDLRLTRSYVRGTDFTPMLVQGNVNVTLENSLIAAASPSLVHVLNLGNDRTHLRLFRSTLMGGENVLTFSLEADKVALPSLNVIAWDSLLIRSDLGTPQSDLLVLKGEAKVSYVQWKAINTLYSGWKRLLVSPEKTIGSGNISAWRSQWLAIEGDQEGNESWPAPEGDMSNLPAHLYRPVGKGIAFAATSGPGALGCVVGLLPAAPRDWQVLTYDRYPVPLPNLVEETGPPPISAAKDERYHGERLDLNRIDLGAHLASVLSTRQAAPRVVLHLTGKGSVGMTPVKISGVSHLVLYFEFTGKAKDELVLTSRGAGAKEGALLDLEGGTLEIINGRMQLPNTRSALIPSYLVRVRNGEVKLRGCMLQGPHEQAPEAFQALIRIDSSNREEKARLGLIQDCVLHGHRKLVELHGTELSVRVKNSVLLAGEDAIHLRPTDEATRLDLSLENNTFAVRRHALVVIAPAEDAIARKPVVIQATQNYFLNPYAEETRRSMLLSISPSALSSGWLLWQGRNNAMEDGRWASFWAEGSAKMKAADWQAWWGSSGESGWKMVEPAATAKTFPSELPLFDRLQLPPTLRPATGSPQYGADIARLGLLRRKI